MKEELVFFVDDHHHVEIQLKIPFYMYIAFVVILCLKRKKSNAENAVEFVAYFRSEVQLTCVNSV